MNKEYNFIDIETRIFRNRITEILNQLVDKILIATCIVDLMQNAESLLNSIVSKNELNEIMRKFNIIKESINSGQLQLKTRFAKHRSSRASRSVKPRSTIAENQMGSAENKHIALIHYFLSQLVEKPEIVNFALSIIELKSYQSTQFYNMMLKFKNYMINKINTSYAEEKIYKQIIYEAYIRNKKYRKKIKKTTRNYNKMQDEFTTKTETINTSIMKTEFKQNTLKEDCEIQLKNIINNSELNMINENESNKATCFSLENESKSMAAEYKSLIKHHLKAEKKLRFNNKKIETQLVNILDEYDERLWSLQEEYESLWAGYTKELVHYNQLKSLFEVQEAMHIELMTEKRKNEELNWTQRYLQIRKQLAAKVIQRWWRKVFLEIKAQKKSKTGFKNLQTCFEKFVKWFK